MNNGENKSRIEKVKSAFKTAALVATVSVLGGKASAQQAPVMETNKTQAKTEVSSDKTASTKSLLAFKFGISKENMDEFTSIDNVSQNIYKNENGQEISQTFSKVGSWIVMDESLPDGSQHIVAKQGKKTLDFTQKGSSDFVKGTYNEKVSDDKEAGYTANFSGELGSSKFNINSNDFSSVDGIVPTLLKITKTASENREQFKNLAGKVVDLQSSKDAKSSVKFASAAKTMVSR